MENLTLEALAAAMAAYLKPIVGAYKEALAISASAYYPPGTPQFANLQATAKARNAARREVEALLDSLS